MRLSDASSPNLTAIEILDPTKVLMYAADIQSATPGVGKDMNANQLQLAMHSFVLTATSHGRVSGDIGKPMFGGAILDDTSETHFPNGVLLGIPNTNTVVIAGPGAIMSIPVALLEDGASYDITTSGRFVFWDASVGTYVADLPADTASKIPDILEIISVGASTFTARVRPLSF